MLYPDYYGFRDQARTHNRVVVYREIAGDMVTPVMLLQHYQKESHLFLLESANLDRSFSRYTFFGIRPSRVITFKGGELYLQSEEGAPERLDEPPMEYLESLLQNEQSTRSPEHGDFSGGLVGFMGYDMVNYMGNLRSKIEEDPDALLMGYMVVDEFFVFDNVMGKLYAAVSVPVGDGKLESLYESAVARTRTMAVAIQEVGKAGEGSDTSSTQQVDFRHDEFTDTVEKLRGEITSGEAIQVVLSNRYSIKSRINPVNLYRTARNVNPSPYMFYLKFDDEVILGTSPEIHLKVHDRKATLKPIAGTYRLEGRNNEDVKRRLLEDKKERAEHLMLLDLARNDLYTGCYHDSVEVTASFMAEEYSHVVHIVSEVQGTLRNDVTPLQLFCNTFPAGTVSGAPKVRAMELIDQYEKTPRGFYAGCAGYFSFSQDVDTCILIRSARVTPDEVTFRAGAGIVYDSVPEKEYQEVENKLRALFEALKEIPTLEEHNVFNDR